MFVRVEKTGEFEKEKRRLEVKQRKFCFLGLVGLDLE
jgi:hypothetical protein